MNAPDTIYINPQSEVFGYYNTQKNPPYETCYINKQSLVTFIEDCIAENLENTTDENQDNHEGYHQACWDIIYRINQMCK